MAVTSYPNQSLFQKQYGAKLFSGSSGIIPFAPKETGKIVVPNSLKK